jgi:hypothetical protein
MGLVKNQKLSMTPEVIAKLEEAAAMDCSIPEMAFFAGISRQTLHNWLRDLPDLKERLDELRNKPVLKARSTIIEYLGKEETAKWYLEKKKKDEFGREPLKMFDKEDIQSLTEFFKAAATPQKEEKNEIEEIKEETQNVL